MTGKQRLLATLKGERTDRAPIWLRDQFNYGGKFPLREEKMLDVLLLSPFTDSWVNEDKNLQAIKARQREIGSDIIREFVVPGKVCNRLLCTPPSRITLVQERFVGNERHCFFEIDTPRGRLTAETVCNKNISTMWNAKYLVEDESEIEKLLSIPFELEPIDCAVYERELELLGDDGVIMMQIDTPLITVSGLMAFEDFLILCHEDKALLKELCDIAFERVRQVVEACLAQGMGDLFRLNGSEQATPPMNAPEIYRDFVYPYEKELAALIHGHGKFVSVHSHGKVKDNLPLMIDAGIDMLDPIEPPPAGDLTFAEAQEIVQGRMTLAGNIQFSDLEHETPAFIEEKMAELFVSGSEKVVLNATASPITFVSDRLRDNYLAMLDAGIKYGVMK